MKQPRIFILQAREDAKHLLWDSDWAALPDVNLANKQEWLDYRAALRAIVLDETMEEFTLPTTPEKIWSK